MPRRRGADVRRSLPLLRPWPLRNILRTGMSQRRHRPHAERRKSHADRRRAHRIAQHLRHIGEVLRAARHRAGLSVVALADRTGVSPRRINQAEEGGANLSLRTLILLAWELGLQLSLAPGPVGPAKFVNDPRPVRPGGLVAITEQAICSIFGIDPAHPLVSRRRRR